MQILIVILSTLLWPVDCSPEVLDPALFLSPSPPLTGSPDGVPVGEVWSIPLAARVERNADVDELKVSSTPESTDVMDTAETFWPGLRATNYGLRGVHIPLTFSVSGNYGNYAMQNHGGGGVVGSSYASVSADESDSSFSALSSSITDGNSNLFGAFGKMGLAGSSYGSYGNGYPGTRIYGGNNGASWSGWGNGKWGHYGKG